MNAGFKFLSLFFINSKTLAWLCVFTPTRLLADYQDSEEKINPHPAVDADFFRL